MKLHQIMGISVVHKSKYCLHLRIMIFLILLSILTYLASSPFLKDDQKLVIKLFKFLTAKIGITILALIQNIKFFRYLLKPYL